MSVASSAYTWGLSWDIQQEYIDSVGPDEHVRILDGDFAIIKILEPDIRRLYTAPGDIKRFMKSPKHLLLMQVYIHTDMIYPGPNEHFEIHWRRWRNQAKLSSITRNLSNYAFDLTSYLLTSFERRIGRRVQSLGFVQDATDDDYTELMAGCIYRLADLEDKVEQLRLSSMWYKKVPVSMMIWDVQDEEEWRPEDLYLFGVFHAEDRIRRQEEYIDLITSYPLVSFI
jgi:hypothetical protein